MLKLRFKDNPNQSVWLVEPKVTLGGSPENDLVLSGMNTQMHHAEVLVQHEKVQIQLIQGAGDTFINERRINADRAYPLAINDVIRICGQELQLVDPKQEPRPKSKKRATEENTGWALKANSAALSNRVYSLAETTVIGRSNECDISLGAAHLSRRHASLHVKNGLLYVKDLGSSNGTYLNGERIAEARVKRGDELCFDTLSFGVIGPSDELDKTTVRSVAKPVLGKPAASASKPTAEDKAAQQRPPQGTTSNRTKPKVSVAKPAPAQAQSVEPAKKSSGSGLIVGAVVLLALAVGVWWISQS